MSRYVVMAGWDDAPHLSEKDKSELQASLPPHQREARTKGVPALGSGAIYPIPEEDVFIKPFRLPAFWPRAYGLDVGWNCTAAVWGAWDRDNDIVYLYSEHARGQAEPPTHAAAIHARGKWIMGAIDPASRGRSQIDGQKLLELYEAAGLDLAKANNAVESGLLEVYQRLATGRLKIFETLAGVKNEYRLYHRSEKGFVVKKNDHRMDAMRYLINTMVQVMALPPVKGAGATQTTIGDTIAGY